MQENPSVAPAGDYSAPPDPLAGWKGLVARLPMNPTSPRSRSFGPRLSCPHSKISSDVAGLGPCFLCPLSAPLPIWFRPAHQISRKTGLSRSSVVVIIRLESLELRILLQDLVCTYKTLSTELNNLKLLCQCQRRGVFFTFHFFPGSSFSKLT